MIFDDELIVDCFAGGGGASTGIHWAIGRGPDFAINHNPKALAIHAVNHPWTRHLNGDVWDYAPRRLTGGRRVGGIWVSADCTHFARARGKKPRDKHIRGLAWVAKRWAAEVGPRVIFFENVPEFQDWGPLDREGYPIESQKGETYARWIRHIKAAGYKVDTRELKACDYGAPTSRNRFFLVARNDDQPIEWPEPTHGPGRDRPWRTAAECIDWSIPCPSIFTREKPLADKTLARIGRGVWRFVLGNHRPFIVPLTHGGGLSRVHDIDEPMRTVTGANRGELGLVTAFLAKHYGGHEGSGTDLRIPLSTVTARDHHALVASHLVKLYGTCKDGQALDRPMPTVTADGLHIGEVRSLLRRCAPDVALGEGNDELPLLTINGEVWVIVDIGMRMLAPHELFAAQGFPKDYQIAPMYEGKPLSKTAQIHACGNAVCPQVAEALFRSNFQSRGYALAA